MPNATAFADPYAERLGAMNALLADPARQSESKRMRELALLGLMSGDESLGGVGNALLRESATRQQREDAERIRLEDRHDAFRASHAEARLREQERRAAAEEQRQWRDLQSREQRTWQEQQAALTRAAMNANRDASRGAAQDARNWTVEDRMADDFTRDTKTPQTVLGAFKNLQAIAQKPDAASDIAFIFSYMKMLDPGSVVREGEFSTAQNAAGVPDRIRNAYNAALSGQRLGPQQRADMLGTASRLAGEAQRSFDASAEQYATKAQRRNLNPENITGRPYAPQVFKKALGDGHPEVGTPQGVTPKQQPIRVTY
ncbi:MAG: hypothetical protein QM722_15045 [Piscinibacter sp.]